MIGDLLQKFLDQHQKVILRPIGTTPHTDILTIDLPSTIVSELSLTDEYKVYGSCGSGRWSETPWVAVLNSSVTESTQTGYYICYLIDPTEKTVFLSLAVGWTQFSDSFSENEARSRIDRYSQYLVNSLRDVPASFKRGHIDLSAKGSLTKGYEVGQILSKEYSYTDLANEQVLVEELAAMLKLYEDLTLVAGDSILNIDSETLVQQMEPSNMDREINSATLKKDTAQAISNLILLAEAEPANRRIVMLNKIARNPKFATFTKERAHYVCEICGRQPFLQKNGKPYAEADHTKALGEQGVDHPTNMRCLCAQCHAVVTHGSNTELLTLMSALIQ